MAFNLKFMIFENLVCGRNYR